MSSLGATLNNAGRLVREMDRLSEPERRDCSAGDLIWRHGLLANESIHSYRMRVTPGGGLAPVADEHWDRGRLA